MGVVDMRTRTWTGAVFRRCRRLLVMCGDVCAACRAAREGSRRRRTQCLARILAKLPGRGRWYGRLGVRHCKVPIEGEVRGTGWRRRRYGSTRQCTRRKWPSRARCVLLICGVSVDWSAFRVTKADFLSKLRWGSSSRGIWTLLRPMQTTR